MTINTDAAILIGVVLVAYGGSMIHGAVPPIAIGAGMVLFALRGWFRSSDEEEEE